MKIMRQLSCGKMNRETTESLLGFLLGISIVLVSTGAIAEIAGYTHISNIIKMVLFYGFILAFLVIGAILTVGSVYFFFKDI